MPEKTEQTIEVTIIVENHTHNGQPVEKGGKITVTPAERDWLASVGAIVDK